MRAFVVFTQSGESEESEWGLVVLGHDMRTQCCFLVYVKQRLSRNDNIKP